MKNPSIAFPALWNLRIHCFRQCATTIQANSIFNFLQGGGQPGPCQEIAKSLMKLVVRVLFGGTCTSLFFFISIRGWYYLTTLLYQITFSKKCMRQFMGGGGFSVNETLDQSLKCRVLNQLFSSSGRVASTTRFCMSVGRLVSRYVGLSVKKMSKNVEKIKICRKCKKKVKKK